MAGPDGPASDHLNFFKAVAPEANLYSYFALLRKAEARARSLPRIGRSRLPAQNIANLAHASTFEFPGATVDGVEFGATGRPRVRSLFMGLTGPMGAMPLHLTEYAFYERRSGRARPFGDFLDLLTDRMLQFFYRAWADTQPVAQADRPEDDSFARHLSILTGAGQTSGATAVGFPPRERLHFAGLFASRRSAGAIQDALSQMLRAPVRINEFVCRWRDVAPSERTRLGSTGGFNQLGRDAVLGGRVMIAEDTFRIMVQADSSRDYARLLPGEKGFLAVRDALNALKPSHLDWELQLEVDERQVPSARLDGVSRLGLTSWLAPQGRAAIRGDARLRG